MDDPNYIMKKDQCCVVFKGLGSEVKLPRFKSHFHRLPAMFGRLTNQSSGFPCQNKNKNIYLIGFFGRFNLIENVKKRNIILSLQ